MWGNDNLKKPPPAVFSLTNPLCFTQVGLLYEEGVRKAHSSDSSKRTFSVYSSSRQQPRYAASYTPR